MKRNSKILKLPGLVDVHAHLREPGGEQKEDFVTGTMAAVAGGYTQILDMPNNIPPTTFVQALENKIKRSERRIYCDLGFNFGATIDSTKYFSYVYKKVFGLKIYMNKTTGPLLVDKQTDRELIFKKWKSPLPIMVHAEGSTVETAIKLAKKFKRKIHVCHITADQLASVQKAKKEGLKITCEVCPHHLFLTSSDVKRLGPLGIMKPPLLSKQDQKKLWDNIDNIDIVSTDHAPHTLAEKYDQTSPKFGVPGLETTLPLMLSAVDKNLIKDGQLTKMLCTNPRKIFHLPEQKDTYIQVDTSKKFKISKKGLFTKCGWTPFEGLDGGGKVVKVVLRKETVLLNGKFVNKPQGRIMVP